MPKVKLFTIGSRNGIAETLVVVSFLVFKGAQNWNLGQCLSTQQKVGCIELIAY